MIPTVLGPVQAVSVTGSCSPREHLLNKPSPADLKAFHDNPITLARLAEFRSGKVSGGGATELDTASNKLFSLDECVQELASLKGVGSGLVLECSRQAEGRYPSGLAEISERSGMHIVMAASWRRVNGTGEQHTAEVVGKDFEQQLLFGDHAEAGATGSSSTSSRIQAGFIVVQIDGVSSTRTAIPQAADLISNDNIRELEGAAWAQQATTAPIMIVCSHFARWKRVEAALATASAPSMGDSDATVQRFILAGMHGGASQAMTDQVAMLQKGVVLCFDCFGRVEWLPEADYYPSDEESAVRIAMLVRQGFADKIVLSQGVSRRIHLSRYGGHGYGHALRTVPPRLLRLGVSPEDIALMTRDNALRLLDWYTPPPPIEVPKDYLPCSWCKTRFEPIEGEYFHKFQFVYCGIKCLRLHRDTGFDAARVGGER